jgi:ATP-dependent helicase/nuclease subunit B
MKTIHYADAADGLRAAAEWLASHLNSAEVFIVGATRAAAAEFARSAGVDGSIGLRRVTLTELAVESAVRPMAARGLAPVTRLASEAIAARCIHRLQKAGKLHYFDRVAAYPGFPAALAATLTDLRLAGERPVEGDLRLLLAEYEKELESCRLADTPLIFGLAEPPQCPVLLVDPPLPSLAHRRFVERIAERSSSVLALQLVPCESSDPDPLEKGIPELVDSTALGRVRRYLFSTERPPASGYDDSVDGFSAPGEGMEAVEIARRIIQMQVPFDRIAILLRSPERYQFLIEEALRRAGIPAYFSRGSARPDPSGRAFLALLACAAEGCSASRFAEYLSLGQAPEVKAELEWTPPEDDLLPFTSDGAATAAIEVEEDAPSPATPIAWEKLLVDAAVVGGRERWFRRLRGLEQEFKLQGNDRQLEKLANLERFALPLIEMLDALPRAAEWGEWLQCLRQLAAASLRHPESVLAALAELDPMSGIGPVEITEVQQALADRLRFLRREPPHRRYGRVFAGSIEEARGRSFDIVFLPGLAEGVFPRRTFEDPLLLDDARKLLSGALPTREDRTADERQLLRIAVAAAAHRLVFSYPAVDLAQGRPRVPSLYALEIARAVQGRVPKLREFERRMSVNAEARLVWPAPRDPARAIDDAEYDLAWHALHAREKGSSRYLIESSPALARSLRMRWRRWEKKWSGADGIVAPDTAARGILHTQRLAARAYSPTALQNFAACPYKFYLHGIYGLRERERIAVLEQMDPLTRGALFHAVQFEFLNGWRAQPGVDLQAAVSALDSTLDRVAADYEEKLAPAIRRVWVSEIEELRTDLRGWLRLWFESGAEWEPVHFEFAFGLEAAPGHDAASSVEPAVLPDGTLVRGSIDLVERHRTRGVLRVTDHKTGKPPEAQPSSIGGGGVLQPVLYGLAAESITGEQAESGRLFFCTQRGGFTEISIPLSGATRARFDRALVIIDNAIEAGFLPAAPKKDACNLCDYRSVCGPYEETRVRRWKSAVELDALNEIRSMP